MEKDFETWCQLKKKLDQSKIIPLFKERDIWWCCVGVNIGYETL